MTKLPLRPDARLAVQEALGIALGTSITVEVLDRAVEKTFGPEGVRRGARWQALELLGIDRSAVEDVRYLKNAVRAAFAFPLLREGEGVRLDLDDQHRERPWLVELRRLLALPASVSPLEVLRHAAVTLGGRDALYPELTIARATLDNVRRSLVLGSAAEVKATLEQGIKNLDALPTIASVGVVGS